jgi:hypothetical protein
LEAGPAYFAEMQVHQKFKSQMKLSLSKKDSYTSAQQETLSLEIPKVMDGRNLCSSKKRDVMEDGESESGDIIKKRRLGADKKMATSFGRRRTRGVILDVLAIEVGTRKLVHDTNSWSLIYISSSPRLAPSTIYVMP